MLCPFPKVPNAIGELHNLFDLDLTIEVLEDDIAILAQLQSLNRLKLHIEGKPETEEKVVICRKGFPFLKHFWLFCIRMSQLTFEAGTMPNLEKFEVRINSPYGAAPTGIEHLLGLKEILVIIGGCGDEGSCSTRAALSALRKAIDMRSSRPTANIKCIDNWLFLGRLPDGFSWRKYGQKDILDAKHPRLPKASSELT
jgi:hypothetical protein